MINRGVLEYIKSDMFRYRGRTNFSDFMVLYLLNRAFRWQVAFRFSQANGLAKYFGYLLWGFNRSRDRIQIGRNTKIGYGLYIGHGGPVVINPTAVIGDNCNLSQYVTIGSNDGRAASIGNNVYIGPNVVIVENVIIGDNVTIGAGSVVTKDIPSNACVAGNYAKILNYKNPGRYIGNPWKNYKINEIEEENNENSCAGTN